VQANVRALTASVSYENEVTFAEFLAIESARWKVVLKTLF